MRKNQSSPLLMVSSLISSIFGLVIIVLTVYHEVTVKQNLKEIKEKLSEFE